MSALKSVRDRPVKTNSDIIFAILEVVSLICCPDLLFGPFVDCLRSHAARTNIQTLYLCMPEVSLFISTPPGPRLHLLVLVCAIVATITSIFVSRCAPCSHSFKKNPHRGVSQDSTFDFFMGHMSRLPLLGLLATLSSTSASLLSTAASRRLASISRLVPSVPAGRWNCLTTACVAW